MNEIIEKYYQEALEADILCTKEIDRYWDKLLKQTEAETDTDDNIPISDLIASIWAASAKIGFESGFRMAFRFLINL